MSQRRDLVIVGGGAAGIGAALEAQARGLDALILEAGDRLGGRAHTIEWNGHHLDLGCGWLHSAERNSLRIEAEKAGAEIDRSPASWFSQFRDLGFTAEEQAEASQAYEALEDRISSDPPASDRASDALDPNGRWNARLDAISGYLNGAPLSEVSIADWLAYDNGASETNWRLPGGYGSLIAVLGSRCPHRLAAPVSAVSRSHDSVQVELTADMIEAAKVVVAVPTSTLNRIRFGPPIGDLIEAAADLPLGLADKLFLSLKRAEEFPHDAHLTGNPHSAETGSYMIRPMGMPVVECFFGGRGARAIEQLDDRAAMEFAVEELAALLGSEIRNRLDFIALSRWSTEPWIGGSYSHACPGKAAARQRLADAGDDRIAFAGEAVSAQDYSTAHGALDSGKRAVARLFGKAGS